MPRNIFDTLTETAAVNVDVAGMVAGGAFNAAMLPVAGAAGLAELARTGGDTASASKAIRAVTTAADEAWGAVPVVGKGPISETGKALAGNEFVQGMSGSMAAQDEAQTKSRVAYWAETFGSPVLGSLVGTAPNAFLAVTDVVNPRRVKLPAPVRCHIVAGEKTIEAERMMEAQHLLNQGVKNEEVAALTGVWKGADGQFRWWIDDSNAALAFDPLVLKDGEVVTMTTRQALNHDLLFDAYPNIADVPITFKRLTKDELSKYDDGKSLPYRAVFQGGDSPNIEVLVSELGENDTSYLNTLVHEVSHAVQDYEGGNVYKRSGGTSPEAVNRRQMEAMLDERANHEMLDIDYLDALINDLDALGNVKAKTTVEIVRDALWDPGKGYLANIGEQESYLAGRLAGSKSTVNPAVLAARINKGMDANTMDMFNPATFNIEDFLESHPNLWGNKLAIQLITKDKDLQQKYMAKESPVK